MRHERVGKVAGARSWCWRWIEKMEGRGASGGLAPWGGWIEPRGGSKRNVVVAAAGEERVGKDGVVDLDGVVHLADGLEDVVRGADTGWRSRLGLRLVGRVEL